MLVRRVTGLRIILCNYIDGSDGRRGSQSARLEERAPPAGLALGSRGEGTEKLASGDPQEAFVTPPGAALSGATGCGRGWGGSWVRACGDAHTSNRKSDRKIACEITPLHPSPSCPVTKLLPRTPCAPRHERHAAVLPAAWALCQCVLFGGTKLKTGHRLSRQVLS